MKSKLFFTQLKLKYSSEGLLENFSDKSTTLLNYRANFAIGLTNCTLRQIYFTGASFTIQGEDRFNKHLQNKSNNDRTIDM